MPRALYPGERKLAIVEEYEKGAKVPEICRRHGVSERTLYRWLRLRAGDGPTAPRPLPAPAPPPSQRKEAPT